MTDDQGYGDGEACVINLAQQNKVATIGIRPFANGAIVDGVRSEKLQNKQIYGEHQLMKKMKLQILLKNLSLRGLLI